MTEGYDDGPAQDRKPVAKTTIVGGQPDAEPDLQTVPVGLETLLAMAAVDDAFARELLANPRRAGRASGVTLTPTEEQILLSVDRDALVHMIARVGDRIPGRSSRSSRRWAFTRRIRRTSSRPTPAAPTRRGWDRRRRPGRSCPRRAEPERALNPTAAMPRRQRGK
jgi:hypothetical protein